MIRNRCFFNRTPLCCVLSNDSVGAHSICARSFSMTERRREAAGRTCPAPTARSFQKLLNNFQSDRPGFFRVELAGEQPGIYYGYYFLELADYFGQEGIDEKESMNLLYVTVKALLNPNIDDRLVRCIFELRMMAAQGLCPSLFHCVCCERQPVEGEELFFSQQNHGILDKACLGHVNDAKRISAPALYAMQYIVTASLGKLYTFTVTEEVLHELERHIHTYIAANTEKRFKSLEILEIMS